MIVEVSIDGGRYVRANTTFQFYRFENTAASPLLGPETGGTVVQVHGTPDSGYPPYFRFGNETIAGVRDDETGIAEGTSPAYHGSTTFTCDSHDSWNLEISLNGQQYSPVGAFVYYSRDAPCLEKLVPASGPIDGGTNVSVDLVSPLLCTCPST